MPVRMGRLRGCLHAPPLLAGSAFLPIGRNRPGRCVAAACTRNSGSTGGVGHPSDGIAVPVRVIFLVPLSEAASVPLAWRNGRYCSPGGGRRKKAYLAQEKFCSHSIGVLVAAGEPFWWGRLFFVRATR